MKINHPVLKPKNQKTGAVAAKFLFLILAAGLALAGCQKEFPAIDDEIKPFLAGTWRSDSAAKILVFTDNHHFIDSVFCGSINPTSLLYVFQGHYTITDGFFRTDRLKLTYFYDSSAACYISYVLPDARYFRISNQEFVLSPTLILAPADPDHSTELTGSWTTNVHVLSYDWRQTPTLVTGNNFREYVFYPDSSRYEIRHILQYGDNTESYTTGSLPYSLFLPDTLMLCDETLKLEFENDFMYMEYRDEYYTKVR